MVEIAVPLGALFSLLVFDAIGLAAGGSQLFTLRAGPENGGRSYRLLGSASGTEPGVPLPGGLVLPLVADAYFGLTLSSPDSPIFTRYAGALDAKGRGRAALRLAPGTDPSFAGTTLHHAFVAIEPGVGPVFVSDVVMLELGR